MAQDDSESYCGIFAGVVELCTAAEAFTRVESQLHFFKLLRHRISEHSLSFNANAGNICIPKIPQVVWEMVKEELIRVGLVEADLSFFKGATKVVRLNFGTIRGLLVEYGLVLPSTQIFTLETYKIDLLLPVAFPFSRDNTSGTSLLPINIAPKAQPIPISSNPGSSIPSIVGSTDFSIPVQRDHSPSNLTQSMITDASLETVPNDVSHRFERLARLYQLSLVNASKSDSLKEQMLLFKL